MYVLREIITAEQRKTVMNLELLEAWAGEWGGFRNLERDGGIRRVEKGGRKGWDGRKHGGRKCSEGRTVDGEREGR